MNELGSRFFPELLVKKPDISHLNFHLMKSGAEDSVVPTQTSGLQNSEIINLWHYKLIKLWSFVIAAIEKKYNHSNLMTKKIQ